MNAMLGVVKSCQSITISIIKPQIGAFFKNSTNVVRNLKCSLQEGEVLDLASKRKKNPQFV